MLPCVSIVWEKIKVFSILSNSCSNLSRILQRVRNEGEGGGESKTFVSQPKAHVELCLGEVSMCNVLFLCFTLAWHEACVNWKTGGISAAADDVVGC